MHTHTNTPSHLAKDAFWVFVSIAVALALAYLPAVEHLVSLGRGFEAIESFLAGLFFTSIFSVGPAMVALGEIAQHGEASLFTISLFGGMGAVLGDLFLFFLMRDTVRSTYRDVCAIESGRFAFLCKQKSIRWIFPLIGGLIIASPLPDELGLAFFSVAHSKLWLLIPISFVFNFLGVLLVATTAQALL